jgi:hypothetical protein
MASNPVPHEIGSGFEASAELGPIDRRRGGIVTRVAWFRECATIAATRPGSRRRNSSIGLPRPTVPPRGIRVEHCTHRKAARHLRRVRPVADASTVGTVQIKLYGPKKLT